MRQVLLPIDASESSQATVALMSDLAKSLPMQVTLVHMLSSVLYDALGSRYQRILHAHSPDEQEGMALLEKTREKFPLETEVSLVLAEGNVFKGLAALLTNESPDLIAIGSGNLDAKVKSVILGSVTRYVLTHVDVPVLVAGKERWRTEMKHILVPIDGSACAMRAVAAADEMAVAFGARVTLLYVIPDPRKEGVIQGHEAMLLSEAKAEPDAREALEEAQKAFTESIHTEARLAKGVVSRTIEKELANGDYDFVVMGTEGMGSALKRLLLGSVTRHVLEHVKVPVLVVR